MLDKLKFNNLIISNAGEIQKIRVQIVRKIIQRMRKLKTQLDKQPNNESNVVKLRKCVAIVERVKKIKREEIMRNVLLLDKNPTKIVTNSHSTPEEVAIAMIAENKNMQELAKRFRLELNYNEEEDESWKKTLIEIGKQKVKKERRKKRAEQNGKIPVNKSKSKEPKESMEGSDDSGSEESDSTEDGGEAESKKSKETLEELDEAESEESSSLEEESVTVQHKAQRLKNGNVDGKAKKSEINQSIPKDESLDSNEDITKDSPKNRKRVKTPSISEDFNDPNGATKVKKTGESDDPIKVVKDKKPKSNEDKSEKSKNGLEFKGFSCYKTPEADEEAHSDDSDEPITVGVVDPFFQTLTGKPFIAKITIKKGMKLPDDSEQPPDDIDRNNGKKRFDKPTNSSKPKKFRKDSGHENIKEKSLHPSWEAKKKQQSIANFQGKKIVFDDTISTEQINTSKTNKNSNTTENLHPSWAAKQKLKPTIAAFQGKKITFGDDE